MSSIKRWLDSQPGAPRGYKRRVTSYKGQPYWNWVVTGNWNRGRTKGYRRKKRPYRKGLRPSREILSFKQSYGFPAQYRCKLCYHEVVHLTNVGGIDDYVVRGNGPYDPRYAVLGGQPPYYQELDEIYSEVRVFASAIEVRFDNNNDTAPVRVCVVPTVAATSRSTVDDAIGNKWAVNALVCTSANEPVGLNNYMTTKIIRGCKDVRDDDELASVTGGLPSKQWFWHIVCQTADASANDLFVDFSITYWCEFFGPRYVTYS